MNILLIYAYPNHNSLNHTIKEKVVQSLSKTHTLKEIDLYEEHSTQYYASIRSILDVI